MRRIFIIALLTLALGPQNWSVAAFATAYYVSSSTGSDSNGGTSTASAWQTIAHVNAQTFQPGDSVLFKRGDVWNENLVPASSGASGSPITFDAYGSGAAPNLTGYYAVPATAWVLVTGNAWKAPVPATFTTINFCLFGSIWGQKVTASTSNLTAQWDFYLANGNVYVYSVGNPATYYNEPIVPMALSNVPVINVNGRSWLTFQHFLLNWFDDYGVYVQGASDHLVFANMEADSMIPQGTQPLGFYVNESAPGPGDIRFYNDEAHLDYDGFRFDGAATAITMVNDKAYGDRDGALVDNTSAVTYSYCHFYASSLAAAGSTDVEWTSGSGPTAGAGNIAADTAPGVQVWQRYPAEVTLTVDDAGMTANADTYYANTVLPIADAAGVPVGAAITVGYPLAQTLVSEFQGWINAGRDVTSHSMSHTYYTNTDALEIEYTGSGTAATLSISGKTLTIAVTGASDSVNYNLAQGQAQGTIKALRLALLATGKYTATEIPACQGPYGTGCSAYTESALLAQDLADVSGQDVKSAIYHMQLDVTRLTTDEITLSRQWMTTNLTGLPPKAVYVYPGGYETTTMQGITSGVPYTGARGALKEDLGVKDTYATGFDVQNITSFGVNPSWQGLQAAALNQKIQALVWKQRVWGVPWGIFWHLNELNSTEITNLIGDFKTSGAAIQTNTGLVNWLIGGTQESGTDGNSYYKFAAASMALDFRPTKNSPVVDAGQNLGVGYEFDINGVNQNSYGSGWEIGAHAYVGYAVYGSNQTGSHFTIGMGAGNAPRPTLPQVWVNNNEGNAAFSYELSLPGTWVTGPAPGCTFHAPYWTGAATFAGLQSAVNDAEGCRTATGVGIALDIPHALYTTSGTLGLVIPQTNTVAASNFLVLRSTQDSLLPNGTTVCSHGIQDNLSTSTDPGVDNPDCAGDVMYYQLGTTVTSVPAGAFTLANGTPTNTSNYNDVQYMWTLESSGSNPSALTLCSPAGSGAGKCSGSIGPDHWLIEDGEFRQIAGHTGNDNIVQLGAASETSTSQLPTHIHFRKIWVHGDWPHTVAGLKTGANSVSTAISFGGCIYCSVVDSHGSESLRPGGEGHFLLLSLANQIKIAHNWFEGQSIGSLCGGAGSAGYPIAGFIPCLDMQFTRNHFTFPYVWLGQSPITGNPNWPGSNSIVRKNGFEIKEGQRIVVAGNIIDNIDNSGAQNGPYGDYNTTNSSSGWGSNYQAIISDIYDASNLRRNSCEGLQITARGPTAGSNGGSSFMGGNILITNGLMYNASISNPGCSSATNNGQIFGTYSASWNGTIARNSAGTISTFTATCSVLQTGNCPAGPPSTGLTQTDINAGDHVFITGCTDTSFNTPTGVIYGTLNGPLLGPATLSGTLPGGLTVVYPNTGTGSATETSGNCQLNYLQGGPLNLLYTHNTFISDKANSLSSPNTQTNQSNYAINNLLRDSIFLGSGWSYGGGYEGTRTEKFNYDTTSLTADHLVWPTRTASSYTEYGNNPYYPDSAGCTGAGCNPPTTMHFPATAYCIGATSTSACVGFVGAMSMSSMPLVLSDYHQYALRSDSSFHNTASDGSDIGANIGVIDIMQTQNPFVCPYACGTPGPFPE